MVYGDGEIVGMYKGEPMIESICQNLNQKAPNKDKEIKK
jgi:hypothetical protein